ncbi:MAG: MarR family winged helix-turn-helix transcriptional regulator [Microthrixaceae bacterium]
MLEASDDAERLQQAFSGMVRALGLLRPDTTPCGLPISVTEAHALGELHDRGPLTQRQLAAALGLQKSTISRLVDQLEGRDLARRSPNPDDGRSVLVALTDNGTIRAGRLARGRRELFGDLIERLSVADRRTVIDGLTRLEEAARGRL